MRGGLRHSVEGPPWGPFPPPPPKKKSGGKRSSKETTYDFYGCCPDGCHTDFDAFSCCSRDYSHFDPWSLDRTMRSQRTLGTKKIDDDLSWTTCVLISLRVMLSDSLIRIYSQSWGSSVDALNTTYPSPLPDHRVLLTVVFVPLAHALTSTPTGRITMLYFRT